MEAFLVKNILLKLEIVTLNKFVIKPCQQHIVWWNWVNEWKKLIPVHIMAGLLRAFFPKWLHVLAVWLNHSHNFDQVSVWFNGWKNMFGNKLLAESVIKEHFQKALDMMNRSVIRLQNHQLGLEHVSYLTNLEST